MNLELHVPTSGTSDAYVLEARAIAREAAEILCADALDGVL